MGYCYQGRQLCCDICGLTGGARKMKCPHGYCPAIACCDRDACRDNLKKHRKEVCSTRCKIGHKQFVASQQDQATRLANGEWLRCAAVQVDGYQDCVKVWFRNKDGDERIQFMSKDTYHEFYLLDNVSLTQFEQTGMLFDGPIEFGTPKQVLVHHVTGAIERGEKQAIACIPAQHG